MSRTLPRYAFFWTSLVILLAPVAAQADFYTLDGRFQCLDSGDPGCGGPGRVELHPPPAEPAKKEVAALVSPPIERPAPPRAATNVAKSPREQVPHDPVLAIATRIKTDRPSAEDLQLLRDLSHAGNARATELLAWCDYHGIGVPRDAVAAYVLYGIAALAGISHARANQAVIYEYALSSDQRQRVLDIENEVKPDP